MIRRHRLVASWAFGAIALLGAFYAATAWLWSAVEESRAASLEREVVSVLSNDLAEGNLFKLGQSLSKLQQEGHLRSAEIRRLGGSESDSMVFRAGGQDEQSAELFSGFSCGQPRRIIRHAGGVALVTTVPSSITGAQCIALFMSADLPEDLKRFRNRLMTAFGILFMASFALFAWFTIAGYRRILEVEVATKAALGKIAAQVAHDIRSPLAALDSVMKDVSQLPEEKRLIVRSAISRIRDIANQLIDKHREAQAFAQAGPGSALQPAASEPASVELLSSQVDPLITEKRMQARARIGIEIEGRLDASSYGLFASIQPGELKRVLSNLINNSVEALGDKGKVTVSMTAQQGRILLKVEDNGKGIPPGILARLGRRGETYGKAGGSGLGLFHAKTCVESWGGKLDIASTPGKGTVLTMELPQAQSPEWFVSRLELEPRGTVVILDDDTSIHQIWQGRFDSAMPRQPSIEVLHFSTPAELRGFVSADQGKAGKALYLTDYELTGREETGLSLVEELGLGERSILVTSRFEEKNILAECRRLKVRMIPKGLAGFVPIALAGPRVGPDAVLLDDDALVRMNWAGTARAKGLDLKVFSGAPEFLAAVGGLPKATAIYLDSKLGNGLRGEDIAKELHAQGFTELYLATGYDAQSFSPVPWIKKVVGKEPPWA